MLNAAQVEHWPGRSMIDRDGVGIGTIKDVFADDTGRPVWATVKPGGRFSRRVHFVAIADAKQTAAGVVVPFTASQVAGAPDVDRNGDLTARDRRALHDHYDLDEHGAVRGGVVPVTREDAPGRSRTEPRRPTSSPSADPSPADATQSGADPTAPGAADRDSTSRDPAAPEPTTPEAAGPAAGEPVPPDPWPSAPTGPADLQGLPTFGDPHDGPPVGDPSDPRFDPGPSPRSREDRPPGGPPADPPPEDGGTSAWPDEELPEWPGDLDDAPPADDRPLAAAAPGEDPLLSDDPELDPLEPPDDPSGDTVEPGPAAAGERPQDGPVASPDGPPAPPDGPVVPPDEPVVPPDGSPVGDPTDPRDDPRAGS